MQISRPMLDQTQGLLKALSKTPFKAIRQGTLLIACSGFLAFSLSAHAAPSTASSAPAPHDLSGVWWIEKFEPALIPDGGGPIPFTPEGRAQYQKNVDLLKSNPSADTAISKCLPQGLPRAMNSAYPLQIIQRPTFMTFIHEENHNFWSLSLNGKHPAADDIDPSFMGGSSIGHWDGNALLIDSTGFKQKSFLDETGLPHSTQLHVVQRLQKSTDGQHMDVVTTIEDPVVFTGSWQFHRRYEARPDVQIMEYFCDEPHRYLPDGRALGERLKWSKK